MNRQPNTTITKTARCAMTFALTFLLLLAAAPLFAHGGFDHVIGTVVKVDNNVMTVKTAKGDVDVKLAPTTELSRGDQKVTVEDLKPGSRVVVDIPEGNKEHLAHSVKVGVAGHAAAAHK